ncbi:MAG: CinA family protein [Arenicellales bacterium]
MFDEKVSALARALSTVLIERNLSIATVESCTGGGVAALFTSLSGSSVWFDRGFVTYSNASKTQMVGVPESTLVQYGAVSEQTASAMAEGGVLHSDADIALSITGIAGPSGGTLEKPVGTVCFAWSGLESFGLVEQTMVDTQCFMGDRTLVRSKSIEYALQYLLARAESSSI